MEPVLRAKIDGALALDEILAGPAAEGFCPFLVARGGAWRFRPVRLCGGQRLPRALRRVAGGGGAAGSPARPHARLVLAHLERRPRRPLERGPGAVQPGAGHAVPRARGGHRHVRGRARRGRCPCVARRDHQARPSAGWRRSRWQSRSSSRRTSEGRRRCRHRELPSSAGWSRWWRNSKRSIRRVCGRRRGLPRFGFDSIGLKELAVGLSSAFGVEITPAVFFAHGSIGALAAHLIEEHGDALAMAGTPTRCAGRGVRRDRRPWRRAKAAPADGDAASRRDHRHGRTLSWCRRPRRACAR